MCRYCEDYLNITLASEVVLRTRCSILASHCSCSLRTLSPEVGNIDQVTLSRGGCWLLVTIGASKSSIRRFVITEKAPTGAFSWLNAATTAFTFKTLLRHYAKRALTPRSLNVKLGPQRNYHKGRAAIRHYANKTALMTFASWTQFHVERPWG